MSLRPQTDQELQLWMNAFALERPSLEFAFEQYERLLDELEGRALSDGEVATSLAQLRKNVRKSVADEDSAPQLAAHLDDITNRLQRAMENAQCLDEAEVMDAELLNLSSRLEAAHTMFSTLRAAVARRTR